MTVQLLRAETPRNNRSFLIIRTQVTTQQRLKLQDTSAPDLCPKHLIGLNISDISAVDDCKLKKKKRNWKLL